jgi:SAM-dependent MidA family methyltransferase
MDLALYTPGLGYYEREEPIVGRAGDFYTSVSVGPLLGELIGFQIGTWLESLPSGPFHLIEAGAHSGQLSLDVLRHLRSHHPNLAERIHLCIVEPSPRRQGWQRETLQELTGTVSWFTTLEGLRQTHPRLTGVLYANELLDAFPVHRVAWNRGLGAWMEQGVGWESDRFVWKRLSSPSRPILEGLRRLDELPDELLDLLPDGFRVELAPAAADWWREAAQCIHQGWLLTLDYGLFDAEFLMPHRADGTLRTYRHHRPGGDLLDQPGLQDITAHIHWDEVRSAGEQTGLVTETMASQRQWLSGILAATLNARGRFPEWDASRVRQFQTLTHPEHLGQAFRVLVQSRR